MSQFHFVSTHSQCHKNRSHHCIKLLRYSSFLPSCLSFPSILLSFLPSFLPMALQTISWQWTPSISSSNHFYVFLFCAPFFNCILKSIVFYRVRMLTLQPTPNLEDQDFILDLLSSGNFESAFSC